MKIKNVKCVGGIVSGEEIWKYGVRVEKEDLDKKFVVCDNGDVIEIVE